MPASASTTSSDLEVARRLQSFAEGRRDLALLESARRFEEEPLRCRDELSTELMRAYQTSGCGEAFGFLYELNYGPFLRAIGHHLRSPNAAVDAPDVLQEVFFSIYRYPYKFKPDRCSAFRNWSGAIIRNTAIQFGRRAKRDRERGMGCFPRDEESGASLVGEVADAAHRSPLDDASLAEESADLARAWRIYLQFYLEAVRTLTPREKRALNLVEVDGMGYGEAAARLGTQKVNLKMLIFRARRKICSVMRRRMQSCGSRIERALRA